jgi:hypothetical protein
MKCMFVKLGPLIEMYKDLEDYEGWVENLEDQDADDGYSFEFDETGDTISAEFACDEMEFSNDVTLYAYMGSESERETFYPKHDEVIFKHKVTGDYWVLYREDLFDI